MVASRSSGIDRRQAPLEPIATSRRIRSERVLTAIVVASAIIATAKTARAGDCLKQLDKHHVKYKRIHKKGITIGIEPQGPIGGVTYSSADQPLWMDCSLAVSLAEAGSYMTALGIDHAEFLSLYSKRDVRGTNQPSKHSYALAIDVSKFSGPDIGTISVADDFEQGLGDNVDCIGQPSTDSGKILETLKCQLVESGLFFLVLTPDYDDSHYNHFHLEARAWSDRAELRATTPAIH